VDAQLALDGASADDDAPLVASGSTTRASGDGLDALLDDSDVDVKTTDANGSASWQGRAGSLTSSPTPTYLPRPPRRSPAPGPAAEPMPTMGEPAGVGIAAPGVAAPAVAQPPAAPFAGPGAYVPPLPVSHVPAAAPAPAREWAGHAAAEAASDEALSARAVDARDARARLLDFARWLSVAGSAFAAVGFLLPWGQVVIGSNDLSYFGRWGIAGPWHIVVALAVLAILGLALIENPVPVWLRTGLAGLGIGALLLGLVWPYLALPVLGTGPGALIGGIGGAALVVSGLLVLVTDRHAGASRSV
jgi:hypothetical protein